MIESSAQILTGRLPEACTCCPWQGGWCSRYKRCCGVERCQTATPAREGRLLLDVQGQARQRQATRRLQASSPACAQKTWISPAWAELFGQEWEHNREQRRERCNATQSSAGLWTRGAAITGGVHQALWAEAGGSCQTCSWGYALRVWQVCVCLNLCMSVRMWQCGRTSVEPLQLCIYVCRVCECARGYACVCVHEGQCSWELPPICSWIMCVGLCVCAHVFVWLAGGSLGICNNSLILCALWAPVLTARSLFLLYLFLYVCTHTYLCKHISRALARSRAHSPHPSHPLPIPFPLSWLTKKPNLTNE